MDPVQMMQAELSSSPSFSCYSSSETFAQIAARVIDEFRRERESLPHSLSDDDPLFHLRETDNFASQGDHVRSHHPSGSHDVDADADDFEFAFVCRDPNSSPVSADDIFYNGQIRPIYPLFDRNLLFADVSFANDGVASVSPIPTTDDKTAAARRRHLPLRKLMSEERETASCSSSTSETEDSNELDGVAAKTYCVWTPKSTAVDSAGRPCKKSNSTGSSSKRWKLRDLLLRSHSNGKEPVLFLGASKRTNKVAHEVMPKPSSADNNGAGTGGAAKEGDPSKRKSFLPHRQELVGLFTNVNGLGRNLHPF